MSKTHVYDENQLRQPVWLTLDVNSDEDGFTLLVPIPHEEDMWLVHGVPTRVIWKRWKNMGERAYTDRNEYLGWFYKPARGLEKVAFSKVHPQLQDLMQEEGSAP